MGAHEVALDSDLAKQGPQGWRVRVVWAGVQESRMWLEGVPHKSHRLVTEWEGNRVRQGLVAGVLVKRSLTPCVHERAWGDGDSALRVRCPHPTWGNLAVMAAQLLLMQTREKLAVVPTQGSLPAAGETWGKEPTSASSISTNS